MKAFPVSVIASVYHNRLLCGFNDYRQFLNHMTGTDVPLWDVARARVEVAKAIDKQVPNIATVDLPGEKTDPGNSNKYVRSVAKTLGADEVEMSAGRIRFTTRTLSEALK